MNSGFIDLEIQPNEIRQHYQPNLVAIVFAVESVIVAMQFRSSLHAMNSRKIFQLSKQFPTMNICLKSDDNCVL